MHCMCCAIRSVVCGESLEECQHTVEARNKYEISVQ
jgi:hypothetical protein